MMSRVFRDAPLVESMAGPVAAGRAYLDEVRRILMRGRPERGKARKRVSAAIGHAIAFSSWQSLVRDQGLAVAAAVELMAEMVDGRANGRKSTA